MNNADLKFEINRKLFHLCSIILPFSYIFVSRITMAVILMLISAITFYGDISRHYNAKIQELVDKFFTPIMRNSEMSGKFKLSGLSYFLLGCFLVVLIFPKGLAITSMLVLILADSFAALVGIEFGSKNYLDKSWAGSLAFFISAFMISILCYFLIGYDTNFKIIVLTSLITTIVELYSKKLNIDDNLAIPLTYAFFTFFLGFII